MRFRLLIIVFCFNLVGLSQENTVRSFPMTEKGLLWKIEGNDLKEPSYLFGTIHMIDSAQYYFPEILSDLVKSSDAVVMEVDESISNPSGFMHLMTLDSGTVLGYLTQAQGDSLLFWFEENMGINADMFNMTLGKMKPFIVYSMMTMKDSFKGGGDMTAIESYDLNIQALSKEHDIDVEGLETLEEQIGFFDSMDTLVQAELLMSVVRMDEDNSEADDILDQLTILYLNQDIDSMYIVSTDNMGDMNAMESTLLTDRNKNWIPKIEAYIQERKCFIAVGAGHLGGPEGLIRLLEERGYILTPIQI